MPAVAPVLRTLAADGMSFDSGIIVMVMTSLRSRVSAALRCASARRRDRGVRTESGFAGNRLHGAGAKRGWRKLGGSRLQRAEGQRP